MKNKLLCLALIALFTLPLKAGDDPAPDPQPMWLPACIVAAVGLAAVGIVVLVKSCEPKYYWLMDDDQPPKFWVGAATRKECQINGWKRIGGPYNRPQDAPTQHPDPTNVVVSAVSLQTITVHASTNMTDWSVVHREVTDPEDFAYFPTNAAMFRVEMSRP
jgi:hypothetical protein